MLGKDCNTSEILLYQITVVHSADMRPCSLDSITGIDKGESLEYLIQSPEAVKVPL